MRATKSASVVWKGDLTFDAVAGSGNGLRMDGTSSASGFSPMELLLVGMAGCTGMDVLAILRKKRQAITDFAVHVRGTRRDEHPKVYTEIEVEYVVRGHAVNPKAVERAIELSQTKYCSASATLATTAAVRTSYRIEATESGPEDMPALSEMDQYKETSQ